MSRTANLELRGRKWYAYRTVPPSIRPLLGKRTLRTCLETSDLAEAIRRRPLVLAAFAQQIEDARNRATGRTDLVAEAAERWRAFAALAVNQDDEPLPDAAYAQLVAEQAAEVEARHGPAAGQRFTVMARAERLTPLDAHLSEMHSQVDIAAKTKAEQKGAVQRLMAWDRSLSLESMARRTASRYVAERLNLLGATATKNKQLTMLSSYFRWMMAKGYVSDNPWRGHFFKAGKARTGSRGLTVERAFTPEEASRLLNGPASQRLADTMRIAALSGMRIEEICMLRVADCQDGRFEVRASKTNAGIRSVPIHSALKRLVERRCEGKTPDAFLIHELGPAPTSDAIRARSDPLGKEFGRYRQEVSVHEPVPGKRRSLVNFHSWRRFFITCAEQAGQPPWVIEAVVGHKRQGMSLSTYSKGPSIEQLRACVEAVRLAQGS